MTTTQTVPTDLLARMNGTKSSAKATASTVDEAQNRFMTMLVAQMKNQDPMNPLDNAQVTSQLAQLSTVTGINKLNTTLEALQNSYQASQSLQSASMIGHGVLVPGTSINLKDQAAVFGMDLSESADNVKVTISDANGVVVHVMDMGAQKAGASALTWDGKVGKNKAVADGAYSFKVTATRDGKTSTETALALGQVSSVTTGAKGASLNVSGLGTFNMSDIRQIF